MLNFLKKTKNHFFILMFMMCLCKSAAYAAGSPTIKVDGYDEIVMVWHETDSGSGFLKVSGSYGVPNPTPVDLSDPVSFHAVTPLLVTSRANNADVTAVAVWKAVNLSDASQVIQVAVATTSGWTANSAQTISNPIDEIPQNDYQIDISNDGETIAITWTAYVISNSEIAVRTAYSNDGGVNWTGPSIL